MPGMPHNLNRRAHVAGSPDGEDGRAGGEGTQAVAARLPAGGADPVHGPAESGARGDDGVATTTARGEGSGTRKPMPAGKIPCGVPRNPCACGSGQGSAASPGPAAQTTDRGNGGHGRHGAEAGNGNAPAPGEPTGWRRRLATAHRIFRKVAMTRLSDEEIERLHAEDTRANTEYIQGGKYYIVHGFTEFGARRDDQDGN